MVARLVILLLVALLSTGGTARAAGTCSKVRSTATASKICVPTKIWRVAAGALVPHTDARMCTSATSLYFFAEAVQITSTTGSKDLPTMSYKYDVTTALGPDEQPWLAQACSALPTPFSQITSSTTSSATVLTYAANIGITDDCSSPTYYAFAITATDFAVGACMAQFRGCQQGTPGATNTHMPPTSIYTAGTSPPGAHTRTPVVHLAPCCCVPQSVADVADACLAPK